MVENVLIDLDNTILDFSAGEEVALGEVFEKIGVPMTPELYASYSAINKALWERLERGEITRPEVFAERYRLFFEKEGIAYPPDHAEAYYEKRLSVRHFFMPGAEETLALLTARYRVYLATNGVPFIQKGRLASAGIENAFAGIFISEELGANKPDKTYFDLCFARMPGAVRENTVMVGDSLTSDILGGKNAGIRTVYYNPQGTPKSGPATPDYEIRHLSELPQLLARI